MKKCSDCVHSGIKDGALICARFPPTVNVAPSQNKITGEMGLVVNVIFPPVEKDLFCGEFVEKSM